MFPFLVKSYLDWDKLKGKLSIFSGSEGVINFGANTVIHVANSSILILFSSTKIILFIIGPWPKLIFKCLSY